MILWLNFNGIPFFDGFESVFANRKGILAPRGAPESSKSHKTPRNERPPSIAISRYQHFYPTPKTHEVTKDFKNIFPGKLIFESFVTS